MGTGYKRLITRWRNAKTARVRPKLEAAIFSANGAKPELPFTLLLMTNTHDLLQLQLSLFSLYQTSQALPSVVILADPNTAVDDVKAAVQWWPNPINVVSTSEIIADARKKSYLSAVELAICNTFGPKLLAAGLFAEHGPLLYTDSDTLWHKCITKLISPSFCESHRSQRHVHIIMSQDFAYSNALDEDVYAHMIDRLPLIRRCAGVFFMIGPVLQNNTLLRGIKYYLENNPKGHRADQTILAATSDALGDAPWPMRAVRMSFSDYWFPRPIQVAPRCILRHYAGWNRNLMWSHAASMLGI